jgi:hypothetical protein
MSAAIRVGFYRELLRRLRTNEGPATFYLQMVQMMLRGRQAAEKSG